MLAVIRKDTWTQPAIFCDECDQQVLDFREALAVGVTDGLVSRIEICHKSCFNPGRPASRRAVMLSLPDFMVDLLRQ